MSDCIHELYPIALDCGITVEDFWKLSILEVCDYINSYYRRKEHEIKWDILAKHYLAQDIAQYVAMILNGSGKKELKEPWDFFPDLFRKEMAEAEKARKQKEMALYKAQMLDYAYRHNHSRKKKEGGS